MSTQKKITISIIFIVLLFGFGGYMIWKENSKPGPYDNLATCMEAKGIRFFGAFWCPHCQKEKAMFGKSAKLLPYVECSTPDGGSQLQICKDNKIESYPTWVFPDGSRLNGEIEPKELAEKSECPLN